jgi:hypothetical protein
MRFRTSSAFLASTLLALFIATPEQAIADLRPRDYAEARQILQRAEDSLKRAENLQRTGKLDGVREEAEKARKLADEADMRLFWDIEIPEFPSRRVERKFLRTERMAEMRWVRNRVDDMLREKSYRIDEAAKKLIKWVEEQSTPHKQKPE